MDTPVTRCAAVDIVVGDILVDVAGEAHPTRVLEAERLDHDGIRLRLWTGTSDGRFRALRTIDLNPDTVCTVAGHWTPPTSPRAGRSERL